MPKQLLAVSRPFDTHAYKRVPLRSTRKAANVQQLDKGNLLLIADLRLFSH
jgi:hypothetical protein